MPQRSDIHKVLIIGSGPIIIGQACEFDYSGTQACKALKRLGYEIVLVNSNPATIMTDPEMADVTYIEPLNKERLEQIIAKLGIPPFLLGLSWSTTERMSKQQADILTSELTYYRRLLSPVILRICETFLRLEGFFCRPEISWNLINLQDESEMAKSLLYRAQADQIRQSLGQPLSEQGAAKDAACSHEHRQNST